jgi:hypothetical protein
MPFRSVPAHWCAVICGFFAAISVPSAELPNIGIELAFYPTRDGRTPSGGVAFTRSYSLHGPADGGRLLPGMRLHHGPGRFFYAAQPHAVYQYNADTHTLAEMDTSSLSPELSWPMGAAFDSRRNRIVLASLGGEGHLYAYTISDTTNAPSAGTWSLLGSMENRDVDSIDYNVVEDVYYAFSRLYTSSQRPTIYRIRPDGTHAGEIGLPALPHEPGQSAYYNSELISVNEYLVLFLEPPSYPSDNAAKDSLIYFINPATGEVQLTYRKPVAEAVDTNAPQVEIIAPSNGATINPGARLQITARAVDVDGLVVSVEFFRNGTLLGRGERLDPAQQNNYTFFWNAIALGPQTFTARARDNSGKVTTSAPLTINVLSNSSPTNLTFELSFFVSNRGSLENGQIVTNHYTLNGAREGEPLLPGVRLVGDDDGRFFGAPPHQVIQVSPDGTAQVLALDRDVPELSWPTGIAYDAANDRVLVSSLGGEGFLYTFDPDAPDWSVLFSFESTDIDSIVKHSDGRLYAVRNGSSAGVHTILQLDEQGNQLKNIRLPAVSFGIGSFGAESELVSVGDYLVLILEGWRGTTNTFRMMESRIFLINPATQEARLTYSKSWLFDTAPIPPPTIRITSPVPDARLPLGTIELRAILSAPRNRITKVEFFANGESIGQATTAAPAAQAAYTLNWLPRSTGNYVLTAHVTDAQGRRIISPPLRVTVAGLEGASFSAQRLLPDSFRPGTPFRVEIDARVGNAAQAWALEDKPPAGCRVIGISDAGQFDAVSGKVKFGPFFSPPRRGLYYHVMPPFTATGTFQFAGVISADGKVQPITGDSQITASQPRQARIQNLPGGDRVIRFDPDDRQNWTLEFTETLFGGEWKPVTNANVTVSADGELIIHDPDASSERRFYRLRRPE